MTSLIPVAHGYSRVSKPDDATQISETQLHVFQEFEICEEHIFTGGMTLTAPCPTPAGMS